MDTFILNSYSGIDTVICSIKKKPKILNYLEISFHYTAEADEFWSYVGGKDNQRWTWYAMDKSSGIILAWVNGRRTDRSFEKFPKNLHLLVKFKSQITQ